MLKFMNELSHFSEMFSLFKPKQETPSANAKENPQNAQPRDHAPPKQPNPTSSTPKNEEKNSSTATQGIADEFIERCLQNYFKTR